MAWRISAALVVGLLGLSGVSCGGDDGPGDGSPEFLCNKLDECNRLPGISERECVEITQDCLDDHTSTQSRDWETKMEQCAEFEGCAEYLDCWAETSIEC